MNNYSPIVSIIVPCYNQGKYIAEALESVKRQTFTDWECIIIDDGSTDNSKDVALKFCNKDNRFKYYFQSNQGLAISRNNGIKKSSGKYILPLDADDLIDSDYVAIASQILDNQESVKVVYCKADFFGEKTGEWLLPKYSIDTLLIQNCIFCTAMFRHSDYNQTKGYNPNMQYGWEDWDFWLSLLENGGEVYQIPEILFHYRKKEQSMLVNLANSKEHQKVLVATLVCNHPNLYYQQYMALHKKYSDITHSRIYSILQWFRKIKRKCV